MFELTLNINIRNTGALSGGYGLDVRESFQVNAADFMEIAKILGQFHDLAQRVAQWKPVTK